MKKTLLLLVLLPGLLFGQAHKLAIDIGSNSIKTQVGDARGALLYEQDIPLPIRRDINESGTGIITQGMQKEIVEHLDEILQIARNLGVSLVAAVATEPFRIATNADVALKFIEKETGIEVAVVSEQEEGILGYEGALRAVRLNPRQLIVWDLGGGSMEITSRDNGTYEVFTTDEASLSFASKVVAKIKRENPQLGSKPYPLSKKEMDEAVKLAKESAAKVPESWKSRLHSPGTTIVGIGGLAFLELDKKGPTHTLSEIKGALYRHAGRKDEEFKPRALSDLALVIGYMEALGFDHLTLANLTLADGLIAVDTYDKPLKKEAMPAARLERAPCCQE